MKIQFLNGGLANQAFQYIFARHYELSQSGDIMYLDDSYFAIHTVHNGYELERVFGIKAHMLSECFDKAVWEFILEEKKKGKSIPQIFCENQIEIQLLSEVGEDFKNFNPFDGKVWKIPYNQYMPEILDLDACDNLYYHGYWINKNWFAKYRDIFLQEFRFPKITDKKNREYLKRIRDSLSVAVQIRTGDYVTLDLAWSAELYRECFKQFVKQAPGAWECFVFSDDIEWCKTHVQELGLDQFKAVTYVEGNVNGKNYVDMQLMSMCKGMVMSNSAFCYLAALLNKELRYVFNPTHREI